MFTEIQASIKINRHQNGRATNIHLEVIKTDTHEAGEMDYSGEYPVKLEQNISDSTKLNLSLEGEDTSKVASELMLLIKNSISNG